MNKITFFSLIVQCFGWAFLFVDPRTALLLFFAAGALGLAGMVINVRGGSPSIKRGGGAR